MRLGQTFEPNVGRWTQNAGAKVGDRTNGQSHLVMKRGNGKSKIFMEVLGKSHGGFAIAMSDYRRA